MRPTSPTKKISRLRFPKGRSTGASRTSTPIMATTSATPPATCRQSLTLASRSSATSSIRAMPTGSAAARHELTISSAGVTPAGTCMGARGRDFLLGIRRGQPARAQVQRWCSWHGCVIGRSRQAGSHGQLTQALIAPSRIQVQNYRLWLGQRHGGLIPPQYVKPFVKRSKTDSADAEAICEALRRSGIRDVAVKTREQQATLAVHRARDLLVRQRTMLTNAIRGFAAEFGIVVAQGPWHVASLCERLQ